MFTALISDCQPLSSTRKRSHWAKWGNLWGKVAANHCLTGKLIFFLRAGIIFPNSLLIFYSTWIITAFFLMLFGIHFKRQGLSRSLTEGGFRHFQIFIKQVCVKLPLFTVFCMTQNMLFNLSLSFLIRKTGIIIVHSS